MTERKTRKKTAKQAPAAGALSGATLVAPRPSALAAAGGPFSRTTLRARMALLTPTVHPSRVSQP